MAKLSTTDTELVIDIDVDIVPYNDTDDGKDHLTHIINPPMNRHVPGWTGRMQAQDIVDIARLMRIEIVALCSYKFIPERNPEKYPVCQICMDIAGQIMREEGE